MTHDQTTPTTQTARPTLGAFLTGILVSLLGLFLIGNAVLGTAVQLTVLGWVAVVAGLMGLVGSFIGPERGPRWHHVVPSALALAAGVMILRHPLAGALALTLLIGAMLLGQGLAQVLLADTVGRARWVLLTTGVLSLLAGLVVLFNIFSASLTLLGVLLGVHLLSTGISWTLGVRR